MNDCKMDVATGEVTGMASYLSAIRRIAGKCYRHIVGTARMAAHADTIASDVSNLQVRVHQVQQKLNNLEKTFDLVVANEANRWLYANRVERMDATVEDLFDPKRRAFHLARYEFAARYVEGKNVADIASGTGYGSELLKTRGAKTVIGIDIDPESVGYASRRHQPDGVSFVCASGDSTPLPDSSIDVVVSFETIEHVPDDCALLREFQRILRPGGLLICSTPNNWPLEIAPYHTRVYDQRSFESTISEFFSDCEMWNQNSGSSWEYNHGQPAGITRTTSENEQGAECFIVVARKASHLNSVSGKGHE